MTGPVSAQAFVDGLANLGIRLVTSVPCSFFSGPLRLLDSGYPAGVRHVAAVNEGSAVAIAAGSRLAGEPAAVLVQNSGFGNLINPLTSLVLPYRIPLLVAMSMRGWPEAGPGEQQHMWMGRVAGPWLDSLGIPYSFLPGEAEDVFDRSAAALADRRTAFVLVGKGGIGDAPDICSRPSRRDGPTRGEVITAVLAAVTDQYIVSTTGYLSRGLFNLGDRPENFYMQGSMGHAAGVALGCALARPDSGVVILDGDGAALMHLGTLATIGHFLPENLTHLVFDNGGYESTGAQPTAASGTDLRSVALACGYRRALTVTSADDVGAALRTALRGPGPSIVVIRGREDPVVGGRASEKVAAAEIADRFGAALMKPPGTARLARRPPAVDRPARVDGRAGTYFGRGTARQLGEILARLSARRVLVVHGGRSYRSSGAVLAVAAFKDRFAIRYFADVPPSPSADDVLAGVAAARSAPPDLVLGIGGGSVMDMAKAIATLTPQDASPLACIRDPRVITAPRLGLVLVPTTCGSGSELTRFATVYVGQEKHSIESGHCRPDAAVIDPDLSARAPARVAAAAGADALCHAIESSWAVAGTDRSRALARQAAVLLLKPLGAAAAAAGSPCEGQAPREEEARHEDLALGAALAGAAIDLTRTTAAHALSYPLTARLKIPHGYAVALHMRWLIGHNAKAHEADCRYPGGAEALRALIADLQDRCWSATGSGLEELLRRLLAIGGQPTSLAGLELDPRQWLPHWTRSLTSVRADNNPRLVTSHDVAAALSGGGPA